MEYINDDLLLSIFAHLSLPCRVRLELVNKRWCYLLWKTWLSKKYLDFDKDFNFGRSSWRRNAGISAVLIRCAGNLESIKLGVSPEVETVQNFARKYPLSISVVEKMVGGECPKLKRLLLVRHAISSLATLQRLTDLSSSLEELCFENCRIDALRESDGELAKEICYDIFKRMQLKCFTLIGKGSCYGHLVVDDEFLCKLPVTLERLHHSAGQVQKIYSLDFLQRLPRLTSLALERSKVDEVESIAKSCPSLTVLNLSYNRHIVDFTPIDKLKLLRVLILDGNRDYLKDDALASICRSCERLEQLSLECCAALTEAGLAELALLSNMHHLNVSFLTQFTDRTLLGTASDCVQLNKLQVNCCKQITALGLLGAAEKFPRSVRELEICGHAELTNDVVVELCQKCPHLRQLRLACCVKLNYNELVSCLTGVIIRMS